jgi:hypothetical protein
MAKRGRGKLYKGGMVWIRCEVKPGMFPSERYIHVDVSGARPISGFVPQEEVQEGRVRAVISQLMNGSVALLFRGELLSVTNPVTVPADWLAAAAQPAE